KAAATYGLRMGLARPLASKQKPGQTARAKQNVQFTRNDASFQATFGNTFDALALSGSTVSVATFWPSSASSLACAVSVSNWVRVWLVTSANASDGDFMPISFSARSKFALACERAISMTLLV